MTEPPPFGVLTGDIRKSSALSVDALDFVRGEVQAAVDALFADEPGVVAGFEFFRGDAWQLALHDGSKALRAAVFVRAWLRARAKADTRIAIALGGVDRIRPERISLSTGEAFTLSGHALDSMDARGPALALALSGEGAGARRWIDTTIRFCDAAIDDWSETQASHVLLVLEHPRLSQAEIGALCRPPITQQTVERSLSRAHWRLIQEAIEAFEQTSWASVAGKR